VSELAGNMSGGGAVFMTESWVSPPRWVEVAGRNARIDGLALVPGVEVARRVDVEAVEVTAVAPDGVEVPLSIVHRRGLRLDGSAPTLLMGYGAYGVVTTPYYAPMWQAWLERGGVFAVAHVRGGGERGEPWHVAGMKQHKENSVIDFLACAHFLIDHGYTSPARLVADGLSAGALVIGGAITKEPGTFAAAIIDSGSCNPMRYASFASGPSNVQEYGDLLTEEGFRGLLAMDPFHRVRPATPYPAVLLTTGANDARLPLWQSGKLAARLQASSTSGRPVLLRVDYAAGHGAAGSTTATQRAQFVADEFAFALWQTGDPAFAPAK